MTNTTRQIITVFLFVCTVAVNALANIVPFNNISTGDLSDTFEVFFVPAGYVFIIWAFIYTGLLGYVIYQAQKPQKNNPAIRGLDYLFWANCIFNSAWMFAWHWQFVGVSLMLMVAILVTLIGIYLKLGIGRIKAPRGERLFVHGVFSMYMGWITVATVANVTTWLTDIGWSGAGISDALWAAIMLVVATVVGLAMSVRHRDIVYVGVLVWAFIGIAVKHSDTLLVAVPAGVFALVLAASLFVTVPRGRLTGDGRRQTAAI